MCGRRQAEKRARLRASLARCEARLAPVCHAISRRAERHQARVLFCFRRHRITDLHMVGSMGYGYGDGGRRAFDALMADLMGAEAGLVRPHFVSGTHAIAACLFAVLRPGQEMIYGTGVPYDTLRPVLCGGSDGSLIQQGIDCHFVPLLPDGGIDVSGILNRASPRTRLIALQRSCGYDSTRSALSVRVLRSAIAELRTQLPDCVFFVDNCYGEFVESREPTHSGGADLMAGSLIKNPGGGLAKGGGYVVGSRKLVNQVAGRLMAPGLGTEIGATYGWLRDCYQGLFLAPHAVGEALKGAVLAASLLSDLGYAVDPVWDAPRFDLVQKLHLGTKDRLLNFCRGIQAFSPIDSHVIPEASPMPGYDDEIIMAGGTFVQGSSLELSADAPLRFPYVLYLQGGLTYAHVKHALMEATFRIL